MSDSRAVRHGVYLDYFATTPVDPRVLEYYCKELKDNFANPSSVDHDLGTAADRIVKSSRNKIADLLACDAAEIIFTSGATESISLFLQGFVAAFTRTKNRIPRVVSSPVEHAAVLENLQSLAQDERIALRMLSVDNKGRINLSELETMLKTGADLVCVMAVNNELGNIYPTERIAELVSSHRAVYFCDATQAIGKIPFAMANHPDTVIVFSGHKFYAPKGIGVLIADRTLPIKPLLFGGSQQRSLRPGTLNAPLIAALSYALELAVSEQSLDAARIETLRNRLQSALQGRFPSLVVNGDPQNRVAGALNVSFVGHNNKQLIARFRHELACSTGAACSSGAERPSHVLKAMQLADAVMESALRLSLGRFTTDEEITAATQILLRASLSG